VIELLKSNCVNAAIDQWYQRRQKDAEGDFYRKVAGQVREGVDFNATTQGLYLCTADGKLLGFTNHRSPDRVKAVLRKGLADFKPADAPAVRNEKPDRNFSTQPPEGGLVVTVTSKILEGYEKSSDAMTRMFQESLGRDTLWVRRDEHAALARGEFPPSLKSRLARFNLFDNTRGEPAPWEPSEVRKMDLALQDGILTGAAHLERADGKCGYRAELRGAVESKDGKVTRFDLVARGEAWGWSGVTEAAAPKGRFTLAIAFRLAPGTDEADRIAPQGAKSWLPDYLR
jgi:hypothetical protein